MTTRAEGLRIHQNQNGWKFYMESSPMAAKRLCSLIPQQFFLGFSEITGRAWNQNISLVGHLFLIQFIYFLKELLLATLFHILFLIVHKVIFLILFYSQAFSHVCCLVVLLIYFSVFIMKKLLRKLIFFLTQRSQDLAWI
jgi:hypothetical protein